MFYEDIACEIIREHEQLANDRVNFDSQWDEIARRVIPEYKDSFLSQDRTPGAKRTQEVIDATAAMALSRFGAIIDSLLTPRNQTWHKVRASNPELNKNREVRLYFDEVNRILFKYRYAPKANFSSQNQQNYISLGAFGNGCIFIDDLHNDEGLRYKIIPLNEIKFVENHQGTIDKCIRKFQLTARQAAKVKQWQKKLPERITKVLETNPEQKFWFLHCVKPREDKDPFRKDYKGMAYASYYVSMEEKVLLSEGGYQTFPYAISRYNQAQGEVYGTGPASFVLPAIKTLNEQKKTVLKQGHRIVDPTLFVHDDGILGALSLKPGAVNYGGVNADGRPLVHMLPTGNLAVGKDLMDDERALINDAFLVSLFQILMETPQMTATEVMERTREKGILLAPTLGRQQSEYLGPLIERETDILARQRLLPPMPQIMVEAKGEYTIEYDSPLSRAQRAEEASGLMRTVETALSIVNVTQNPEPLDFFDWDTIVPEVSEINGVPTRWMKSVEQVQQIRQGRAEAAQEQTAINAAPGAAALINASAKAQKAG